MLHLIHEAAVTCGDTSLQLLLKHRSVTWCDKAGSLDMQVFASAEAFDEWFSVGTGDKEQEAKVVEQLHKVRTNTTSKAVSW